MAVAGILIALAGLAAAIGRPLLGLPQAFPLLMACSITLWLTGIGAGVAALAPPRRLAGIAAAGAAVLAWPIQLSVDLAPLWGGAAAVCGVLVVRDR